MATADRRKAEARGRRAETVAALFLRFKGYRILARMAKTPVGEIDLVTVRSKLVAFVEVEGAAAARRGGVGRHTAADPAHREGGTLLAGRASRICSPRLPL